MASLCDVDSADTGADTDDSELPELVERIADLQARASTPRSSGRFYLPLRKGIRQLTGIQPGDTVSVTLEPR